MYKKAETVATLLHAELVAKLLKLHASTVLDVVNMAEDHREKAGLPGFSISLRRLPTQESVEGHIQQRSKISTLRIHKRSIRRSSLPITLV